MLIHLYVLFAVIKVKRLLVQVRAWQKLHTLSIGGFVMNVVRSLMKRIIAGLTEYARYVAINVRMMTLVENK